MPERNLDFDFCPDRKNTDSLKYDFAKRRGYPEDVLPLWVADMDFRTSSYIEDALVDRAHHGIFGYSETQEYYAGIVAGWMKQQHDWDIDTKWILKTPGVVVAIAMAVQAFTQPDDAVLIQQPVYYPFSEVIEDNGRRIVSSDLVMGSSGRYEIDYEDLEKKITDNGIKLFLFCNPHNPGSRVWSKEEIERLGDICLKHNVIVVSDEIHSDFTFIGKHNVFTKVKKEFENNTIVCTSPSKTFNIASLLISNIIIPNPSLRRKMRKTKAAFGLSELSAFGYEACKAAYTDGREWYEAVKKYIWANYEFTVDYVNSNLKGVRVVPLEGTYLVWLDFKGTGLSHEEADRRIVNEAKLWLDSGKIFGKPGEGYQRINIACPRATLEDALRRIKDILY